METSDYFILDQIVGYWVISLMRKALSNRAALFEFEKTEGLYSLINFNLSTLIKAAPYSLQYHMSYYICYGVELFPFELYLFNPKSRQQPLIRVLLVLFYSSFNEFFRGFFTFAYEFTLIIFIGC